MSMESMGTCLRALVQARRPAAKPTSPARKRNSKAPMSRAEAEAVLKEYQAKAEAPPPAVARRIAVATGCPVASSGGTFVMPMSAAEERSLSDELSAVSELYDAMEALAKTTVSASEMVRLGEKHYCRDLLDYAVSARKWLTEVVAQKEGRP